jgi:AcrR family transcriptional regulator
MAAPIRTLSTAEERREEVLIAATRLFATHGLRATPTLEVAKAAGISQAYLFRLFPRKDDLVRAIVDRCNRRIRGAFAAAAAAARVGGEDPLAAMGHAYGELLSDRDNLLIQLHSHAASPDLPEVRDAMRAGFEELVKLVRRESGASDEEIRRFFAKGMLLNVLAALDAFDVDAPWARILAGDDHEDG